MMADERDLQVGLVDIARAFLVAHVMLSDVGVQHRAGTLHFDEVRALVGDDDGAALFRLKERSHTLFRLGPQAGEIGAEEVFDLAVGSLFHEAMKFRENYYQRVAYGPKIDALKETSVPGTEALVREFARILAGAAARLDEALEEAETLLTQTTVLFRVLLRQHADNGLLTRFLLEHPSEVKSVLGEPLDALLAELHGSAAAGFEHAALSYLDSGFFTEAAAGFAEVCSRSSEPRAAGALHAFARGMQAYLDGRYADAVDELSRWQAESDDAAPQRRSIARAALSRVGQLLGPEQGRDVAARAAALAARLAPV
jgi:hypothetical protein